MRNKRFCNLLAGNKNRAMRNLNKARKEASLHREKKGRSFYRGGLLQLQPRNMGSEQRGQKRREGPSQSPAELNAEV